MTKFYTSHTVFGWQVEGGLTEDFLRQHKVGTCSASYDWQCFCGPESCWKNRNALPLQNELTFVCYSPYFECDDDHKKIYLTLDLGETTYLPDLKQLIDAVDWDVAEEIAVRLGAKAGPAQLFSVTDVF